MSLCYSKDCKNINQVKKWVWGGILMENFKFPFVEELELPLCRSMHSCGYMKSPGLYLQRDCHLLTRGS